MINLPMEGTSQEIGRLAGNAFGVKTPKNWIPHPQDGDTDFGIDYLIQLKSGSGQVSFSFYLQLKGTTVPKYDKEKNFISYDFKTKALNYYHNQEPLVMVAVVDLVDESQLWTCPIYYYWLDDEWFEENTEKLSSQQTIALKIPVSNILDNKLDIYDFYASRIQEKLAISDLKSGIRKKDFSVVGVIESFTDAINSKPSIIESLEEKSDVPWFHNPSGTYASDLKRCSESLLSNNIQMAEDILRKLKRNIESLTKNELAELYYQQGTLHSIKGELEEAEQSFCDSFKVDSKERYQLGYFESRFKYESLPSSEILQEMVDSLDNSSYQKCQTKAKCLALLDRADEALDCLAEHYPDKFIGQMLICTISGKTERLDEIISSNNTQEFESEREAFIYYSICARRTLYKATGGSIAYNTVQPIEGRPSYSLELMKQAFDIARAAWKAAKNLGYPADVTMLVDASILIYGYFSKLDELTVHIDLILADRPTNKYIIQPYTRLLFNLGEFEKVIKLIESIDDTNVEDCGLIIMANYNLGKLTDVLELTQKYENQLLESESLQTRLIFCIAAEIARELLEIDIYEKYEKLVLNFKDGAALIAIRKFVSDCNTDRDKCNEYAQELYRTYLQLDKPSVIAEQLFRCLDPEEEKTAGQVIELGTLIAEDRELSNSDYCHLAQAFMTTNSWDKAKDLAEKNISKGVDSSNWKLILAAAEGQKGNVGIALNLVKDALSKNKLSKQQKIYYVNLSLSLGLGDAVIKSVKELLISTTDRNEKIQFLRVLISIYSNNERLSNELNTAVEKLGNLVDQNDCEEEGQYLLFCLTTPSYKNSEEKVIEFQNRLRRYTQTFPDSPILRTGTVDPEGNADSVIKSIQALSGISDEQIERWEKNQRAIRAGTLPVPFSMRGSYLQNTRDIFTTWAYSINYPDEYLEYKIKHAPQLPKKTFITALSSCNNVIIEETSLLTLSELGLLGEFLKLVPQVTVLHSVFQNINQSTHRFGGSLNTQTPQQILSTLQKHISTLRLLEVDGNTPIEKYLNCFPSEKTLLLTDDLYLLQLLGKPTGTLISGNLFNVIEFLYDKEKISKELFHESVASACELGLFEPYMRMNLLHESVAYYLNVVGGVDYSQTRFKPIFTKLFEIKRDSAFCFDLLFRMLDPKKLRTELHPETLLTLFRAFLIRHPIATLSSTIAIWFIRKCLNEDSNKLDLSGRSETHFKHWDEFQSIMMLEYGADIDLKFMFESVVNELLCLKEDVRQRAFEAVKLCFIPTTQESTMFERIYQKISYTTTITGSSSLTGDIRIH